MASTVVGMSIGPLTAEALNEEGGACAGDLFVGTHTGKAQAGVIVDGDVKGFVAHALVAIGSVAGGAGHRSFVRSR